MTKQAPPRKIQKIYFVLPTASTSSTAQKDIDAEIETMIASAAKISQTRKVEIEIHLSGNRKGNHIARTTARKYNNVTTRTHTPDFHKTTSRKDHANEIHRTNGRITAEIDHVLVLEGNRESLTNQDREILASATRKGKSIKTRKIHAEPTRQDMIPEKAKVILPESAYRVNMNDFKNLQAVIDDLATHSRTGQVPIYCGAPNQKTDGIGSPLANQDRYKPNSLKKYRTWIWTKMQAKDPAVIAELRKIEPTTPLICFCHNRKKCHTDIIRKASAYLHAQDAKHKRETEIDRTFDAKPALVYFISGHLDATFDEFKTHYKTRIMDAVKDPTALFVVGDAPGIDAYAREYLTIHAGERTTLYHKGKNPRQPYDIAATIATQGNYDSHTAKDAAMTAASTTDILWVRPGKERSGTARNEQRRRIANA